MWSLASLARNWREADRTVKFVYGIVAAEAALAIYLLIAGWPG